jgi:hypothetical protein
MYDRFSPPHLFHITKLSVYGVDYKWNGMKLLVTSIIKASYICFVKVESVVTLSL